MVEKPEVELIQDNYTLLIVAALTTTTRWQSGTLKAFPRFFLLIASDPIVSALEIEIEILIDLKVYVCFSHADGGSTQNVLAGTPHLPEIQD